jgi:acetoin utilization protein AcuB
MLLTEYVEHHLDTTSPGFTDDDLVAEVLTFMQDAGLDCVPVLHEGNISAMVSLLDLLPEQHSKKRLKELKLGHADSIGLHEHLFEIIARMGSFSCAVIPVSEEDGHYVGVVDKAVLLEHLNDIFHFGEGAVTLELDVPTYDLKLSEVIATLEKNDATVLSCGMYPAGSEGTGMVLTFRLQTHDFFRLVTNLEKYGYLIRYTSPFFREKDDTMREKALEVMRFMEM